MCIKHSSPPSGYTYIATNSAILAAGNKKECGDYQPPSPAVLSGCSLPQQHRSAWLPSERQDQGKKAVHVHLPLGLWRCLESSANMPLPLLWQTLQEEGLAAGPVRGSMAAF